MTQGHFTALPAPGYLEKTHFTSNSTPGTIIQRAMAAVQSKSGEVFCVKPHKSKIKCTLAHEFCAVKFHITVFRVAPERQNGAYIVEFQKRSGDSFIWNQVYDSLIQHLADLSSTPLAVASAERVTKAAKRDKDDTIAPVELAAFAANLLRKGENIETAAMAARAFGLASTTMATRHRSGKDTATESWKPSTQQMEESLQALGEIEDADIQCCVRSSRTAWASLDGVPMSTTSTATRESSAVSLAMPIPPPLDRGSHFEAWHRRSPHEYEFGSAVLLSSSA